MNHKTLLESFGLAKIAAAAFDVTERDIGHWKLRGIPSPRWPQTEIIAKERGIPLTALMLAMSHPKFAAKKKAA